MTPLLVYGWLLTLWVLGSYFYMVKTGDSGQFHATNALLCLPMAVVNLSLGAAPAATLNVAFGIAGVVALVKQVRAH